MQFLDQDKILALTSDASIDFTPTDFGASLNPAQQAYLKKETGVDIPQVFWRKQVHGDEIIVVTKDLKLSPTHEADAFVTTERGLPIAVRTADCVPVFLYDPIKQVIGVVHAGWQGTRLNITQKTAELLKSRFGCDPRNIQAVLGPSGGVCCYEVGPEFKEYFPQDIIERGGKLYADVSGNNVRQLKAVGLLDSNIKNTRVCTICSPNYFSFRRDGAKAGRMISLMMLK